MGILQARILEWVACLFCRASSWPRNQTRVSCIAGRFFTNWATGYADDKAYDALQRDYPAHLLEKATDEHFGTEFLDYKMSIRTVENIDAALEHIATYSSRHSECIISEDTDAVKKFQLNVDAACVYANVSTAFTDGAQFGFGAEIGISTQKLHARGPMALAELTTYKYIIEGTGQTRW